MDSLGISKPHICLESKPGVKKLKDRFSEIRVLDYMCIKRLGTLFTIIPTFFAQKRSDIKNIKIYQTHREI